MSALGERGVRLLVIFVVIIGFCVSIASVLRLGRFLADSVVVGGGGTTSSFGLRLPPFDFCVYLRIILNFTLASCYLYLPSLIERAVQNIGNLCRLPVCYFKFTKIVLLSSILNGIITLWQAVPEICLWHLNMNYVDNILIYLHCSMWIISLMIVLAIDITEITGLNSIFYYHLTNRNCCSPNKSQQFNRFLSNLGIPGSSCLIIVLWAQKVMSFDRFLLAIVWTLGILSRSRTDDKDVKYVGRHIAEKKAWMYFAEGMTVSPLN